MKTKLLAILIAALCAVAANAKAQTVRTLGYNTTNFAVIGYTNTNSLRWSNAFSWSTNTAAATTRSNLGLPWPALLNSNSATRLLGYVTTNPAAPNCVIGPTDGDGISFTNTVMLLGGAQGQIAGSLLIVDGTTNGLSFETPSDAVYVQSALFFTNTTPTNTTNAVAWISVQIGTNSYRVPAYK